MSFLWSAASAADATGGQAVGDWHASGVSIDTRSLQPGDLFVALKDQRDAHEFVANALAKGAAAALVSRIPEGLDPGAPLLIVADVLEGLRRLGAAARSRIAGRVIGVTGSVGKTGAKEMLRTALAGQGRVHAAEKSYNNHWGVPLTLARMPADTDFAIIEIGMNAPGEIGPLARLARPHVALITTVAEVHLAAFSDVQGIAREKAAIFEGLEPGGVAVINRDIETFGILDDAAREIDIRTVHFGAHEDTHATMLRVQVCETATCAKARIGGDELLFKIGAPGRHLAMNALGVLAAVQAAGADVPRAALALASWTSPEGRGARWRIDLGPGGIDGSVLLIDESYNANPAAMAAALDVFAATAPEDGFGRISKGRRIALLADMRELGPREAALHADLALLEAFRKVDLVHCAGPLMRGLYDALPKARRGEWHADTTALAARIPRLLDAGDAVMAKGSLGSNVQVVIDAIKKLGNAHPADETGG